jgi:hypothetical protein
MRPHPRASHAGRETPQRYELKVRPHVAEAQPLQRAPPMHPVTVQSQVQRSRSNVQRSRPQPHAFATYGILEEIHERAVAIERAAGAP